MPESDGNAHRIVVGVDGSESSLAALRWAVRQGGFTGATVDAVAAWEYPAAMAGYGWVAIPPTADLDFSEIAAKTLAEAISRAVDPASDVKISPRVAEGTPAGVLLEAAKDAELLVVGSRGHGGFAGALLGSVSQHCVSHATCPVLVLRSAPADGAAK